MLAQDNIAIKGDTIELQFQLFRDKCNSVYWDLTNHEIRFQLNSPTKIYKATSNVTGGSSSQINVTDPTHGIFVIIITPTQSSEITPGDYNYEIQITTPAPASDKYTVLQSSMRVVDETITWGNVPS